MSISKENCQAIIEALKAPIETDTGAEKDKESSENPEDPYEKLPIMAIEATEEEIQTLFDVTKSSESTDA